MQKIVINGQYGGFGLSDVALQEYKILSGKDVEDVYDIPRDDPHLVQIVEALGEAADGDASDLLIACVPDGVEWHIQQYDGLEHVAENHRCWWGYEDEQEGLTVTRD